MTQPNAADRQAQLLERFQNRLAHVLDNFRFWRSIHAGRRSFNDSIRDLKTGQKPRARRARRQRLHPEIEFAIAFKLREKEIGDPTPADVMDVAAELSKVIKPCRGRPDDRILSHHVEGLCLLFEETSGERITAHKFPDSEYGPRVNGPAGQVLVTLIQSIDSTVTETAIANIIMAMPKPGNPGRKRFREYFPLADGGGEFDKGAVVYGALRIEQVGPVYPIYCS